VLGATSLRGPVYPSLACATGTTVAWAEASTIDCASRPELPAPAAMLVT